MLGTTEIRACLPHAGAMLLLDKVLHFDVEEIECTASSHRDASNPLRLGDRLPIHVGIEYAAQAAGVHGGLRRRAQGLTDTPAAGLLASCSRFSWNIDRLDKLPDDLHIKARATAVSASAWAYAVRIEHQSVTVLSGELLIALRSPEAAGS
jgi:predicted hotdog family 3-hydroxylacyl-ACP dehydratase